jgi:drug/metabolite transporter (DMT)-like permease
LTETYPRSRVLMAFAAVYIVWGSTYLAIRYAVETIPPFLMGGARFLVSGAILYAWTRTRGASRPTSRQWRDASVAGALMLCLGNGAVAWAEERVPSGLAALIVAVVPLWMVLLDWLRPRGTRPSVVTMIGVVVGLAGLIVLIGPADINSAEHVDLTPSIVLILGSLAWAAGSVYSRYGDHPESSALATGMQMIAGGGVLVLTGLASGELNGFSVGGVSNASWIGWIYLVTFGALVGFTAYVYLLNAVSPAKASTYAYVNPVVAVILGWLVAHESINRPMIVGAAIILGAVAMITLSQTRRQSSPGSEGTAIASPMEHGDEKTHLDQRPAR